MKALARLLNVSPGVYKDGKKYYLKVSGCHNTSPVVIRITTEQAMTLVYINDMVAYLDLKKEFGI